MKKLILVLLVGFLCNTVLHRLLLKNRKCKNRTNVKKCSDDKSKKCCSKDAKADNKSKLSLVVQQKNQVALKIK